MNALKNGCIKNIKRLIHNMEDTNIRDIFGESSMKPILFKGGIFSFDPLLIKDFNHSKSVATCFIVCNGKILLLKRNEFTTSGNTWCMPGGKLNQNETPIQAVLREAEEETGILLLPEDTNLIKTIFVRTITLKQDYLLHLFKSVLSRSQPSDYKVVLNQEHTDYLWVDPEEAKQLNLVPGGKEILELNLLRD